MKKNKLLPLSLAVLVSVSGLNLAQADETADPQKRIWYQYGEGLHVKTTNNEIDATLRLYNKFKVNVVDQEIDYWSTGTGTHFQLPQSRAVLASDFLDGLFSFYGALDLIGVADRDSYGHKAFVPDEVSLSLNINQNFSIIAGQWYIPFAKESYSYSEFLYNMEYGSIAGNYFGYLPEVGLGVDVNFDKTNFVAGVFTGKNISDRQTDYKTDITLAALVSNSLLGEYNRETSSDVTWTKSPAVGVGVSGLYSRLKDKHGAEMKIDELKVSADLGYKYCGTSTELELFYDNVSFRKIFDDLDYSTFGLTTKAGYFFIPKHLEGVIRFSWLNFDNKDEKNALEPALGVNYYVFGQNLRVGSMLSYINTSYHQEKRTKDLLWLTSVVALF
ncbi:MAG: OprO/OprP family phosphate-selective porin [Deltaproteobacteria bacterium]|jgi:hypothetical protein|nr:OprO/OprP family phosphate-selective porin [Deltaproteobacteria bacterium]